MISFLKPDWNNEDIDEQVNLFGVLVLFDITNTLFGREAQILIYSKMGEWDKSLLKETIISKFGGKTITTEVCIQINEYAEKWYNHKVLRRRARVINKIKEET